MNRTAAVIAAVLTAAVLALTPGSAQAATSHHGTLRSNGSDYPTCITTKWASNYYRVPKTAPGALCFLPMFEVKSPGSSANVHIFDHAWAPASWRFIGAYGGSDGNYTGWLVQRPAR